jgi:hypothetical protein
MMMKRVSLLVLLIGLLALSVTAVSAQVSTPDDCEPEDINAQAAAIIEAYLDAQADATDRESALQLIAGLRSELLSLVQRCSGIEALDTVTDPAERDGRTRATAVLIGEPALVLEGAGTLVIEEYIRPASGTDAEILSGQTPEIGSEFLLVLATFTCQQAQCDPIEDTAFFLIGDEAEVYVNQTLTTGELFPDQLAGAPAQGEAVTGWIIFPVLVSDDNLTLVVGEDVTGFLALSEPEILATAIVTATSSVNLRECGGTQCAIVGAAVSGDQLTVLSQDGEWYQVRTADGLEAYIFGNLVTLQD